MIKSVSGSDLSAVKFQIMQNNQNILLNSSPSLKKMFSTSSILDISNISMEAQSAYSKLMNSVNNSGTTGDSTSNNQNNDFSLKAGDYWMDKAQDAESYMDRIRFYNNAINEYESAGQSSQVSMKIGEVYTELGLTNEAIAKTEEAIKLDPNNVQAYKNLGNLNAGEENYDTALNNFQSALEIDPTDSESYMRAADMLVKLDRSDEAVNLLNTGSGYNTDNDDMIKQRDEIIFNSAVNAGEEAKESGNYDLALENYNTALEIKSEDLNAILQKADVLNELNRKEDALLLLKNTQNIYPDNSKITEAISNLGL